MKNKRFTYLLIIGVAVVWGIIFYRIFVSLNEEEPVINLTSAAKVEYFKLIDHAQDSAILNLNYRNPFSETQLDPVAVVDVKSPKMAKIPTALPYKQPGNWAGISFAGYINNPTTKRKIAILQVNGQEVMLAEGQSSNGVKLLKAAGDSVKIQYQNDSRYIRIK